MVRSLAAVVLGAAIPAAACDRALPVTVRVAPPLRDEGDAGAPDGAAPRCRTSAELTTAQVSRDLYLDTGRDRCVVLSAEPLNARSGTGTQIQAVRARRIVASGAAPCLGSAGSVAIGGLPSDETWLVQVTVLDVDDWGGDGAVDAGYFPTTSQNLGPTIDVSQGFLCFSAPTCSPLTDSLLALARRHCSAQPTVERCAFAPSGGGVCTTSP